MNTEKVTKINKRIEEVGEEGVMRGERRRRRRRKGMKEDKWGRGRKRRKGRNDKISGKLFPLWHSSLNANTKLKRCKEKEKVDYFFFFEKESKFITDSEYGTVQFSNVQLVVYIF